MMWTYIVQFVGVYKVRKKVFWWFLFSWHNTCITKYRLSIKKLAQCNFYPSLPKTFPILLKKYQISISLISDKETLNNNTLSAVCNNCIPASKWTCPSSRHWLKKYVTPWLFPKPGCFVKAECVSQIHRFGGNFKLWERIALMSFALARSKQEGEEKGGVYCGSRCGEKDTANDYLFVNDREGARQVSENGMVWVK